MALGFESPRIFLKIQKKFTITLYFKFVYWQSSDLMVKNQVTIVSCDDFKKYEILYKCPQWTK